MVTCDREPEISLNGSWQQALPAVVLRALVIFALPPDSEIAFLHHDGLQFLLDEWDELSTPDDFASWVRTYSSEGVFVRPDDTGVIHRCIDGDGGAIELVPRDLVQLLARHVISADDVARTRGIEAVRQVRAEWLPYFFDVEKLLGHLLRNHGGPNSLVSLTHDDLVTRHAQLHSIQ